MPLKVTLVDVPMKELKQDVTETQRISFVGNSFCSERSLARQRPPVGHCLPSDVSCLPQCHIAMWLVLSYVVLVFHVWLACTCVCHLKCYIMLLLVIWHLGQGSFDITCAFNISEYNELLFNRLTISPHCVSDPSTWLKRRHERWETPPFLPFLALFGQLTC